ncbi:MAG: hypothetical protein WED04_10615 [Promethearchaeati archaeon SRVP18_Atabeyarchaeia-1]
MPDDYYDFKTLLDDSSGRLIHLAYLSRARRHRANPPPPQRQVGAVKLGSARNRVNDVNDVDKFNVFWEL